MLELATVWTKISQLDRGAMRVSHTTELAATLLEEITDNHLAVKAATVPGCDEGDSM